MDGNKYTLRLAKALNLGRNENHTLRLAGTLTPGQNENNALRLAGTLNLGQEYDLKLARGRSTLDKMKTIP